MFTNRVVLAALAACCWGWSAAGAFPLIEDGQFVCDFAIEPGVPDLAKADLARVLEHVAGTAARLVEAPGVRPAVVVGTAAFTGAAPLAEADGDEAFRIERSGDNLLLTGASPRAAGYALHAFLEDLGCRWYMPGEIGEVLPEPGATLEWTGAERLEAPDFPFRQIWYAYGGPPETAEDYRHWLARNKVAHPPVMHGHNTFSVAPVNQYFESHPEYYALVDGKRMASQLCTTHPDVIRMTIERVSAYFDTNPDALSYSLCPEDNVDFCECADCTALDIGPPTPGYEDKPTITDRLMVYMNTVAQGIQERHPGKMVTIYAYQNYSTPPLREKVDPHVVVMMTTSVYCAGHGIGDLQCASRQEMRRDLAAWAEACQNVYIYDYDPVPFNAELPWPLFGARAREMAVYKDLGIKGFSFECHNSWATLFPNFYVAARFMWDSGQDADALLEELCARFYGSAAEPMAAYLTALESALSGYPDKIEWGQLQYPQIFNDRIMADCAAQLAAAQNAAVGPAKERVRIAALGIEYLEHYLACREAGPTVSYADYRRMRGRCDEIIDTLYAENKDYILAHVAKEYLDRELGMLASERYAVDMGLANHWMLIGPFDNRANEGHAKAYPPEREWDFEARYPGAEAEVGWTEFRGPDWKGTIELDQLMQPKDWVCAYAACYVTSPSEQAVELRLGSNDGVRVWLNGELVWDNPASRTVSLDSDRVPVTLPKGTSRILLKISQTGKNWGFCFRITDADGNAVKNLTYSVAP